MLPFFPKQPVNKCYNWFCNLTNCLQFCTFTNTFNLWLSWRDVWENFLLILILREYNTTTFILLQELNPTTCDIALNFHTQSFMWAVSHSIGTTAFGHFLQLESNDGNVPPADVFTEHLLMHLCKILTNFSFPKNISTNSSLFSPGKAKAHHQIAQIFAIMCHLSF